MNTFQETSTLEEQEPRPPLSGPAAANIRAIVDLERQGNTRLYWSERVSDRISALVGRLAFVLIHIAFFVGWAVWNKAAPEPVRFDPYPFGLLTLIMSLEGVLIATFVLITQNRMKLQTDRRDRLNLHVDLLAEQEMTLVLRMLRRISDRLGVPTDNEDEARAEKLAEETNLYELVQQIERELPDSNKRG